MRFFPFVMTILLLQSSVYAQFWSRSNEAAKQKQKGPSEHIVSSVKSRINSITGWVVKENGKWMSAKNIILNPDPKYLLPDKVLGQDNLSEMEIREAQVDGKINAVLILKYLMPRYEFPTLKEGFYPVKVLDFYVFPVERISNILPDTLSKGVTHCINLEVAVSGRIEKYDSKDIDFEINTAIQRFSDNRIVNAANLLIAVMPYSLDGKDHVKFKLIKTYPSEKIYQPYLMDDINKNLFIHSYYECPRNEFAAFFNGAAASVIAETPLSDQPTDFNGYFAKGVRAYDREDYYNAITDFTNAIRLMPDQQFYPVYAYRGNAKFKLGDSKASLEDLDKAVALKPVDKQYFAVYGQVLLNRGTVKYLMKDLAGAREDWQQAAQLNEPKSASLFKKKPKRQPELQEYTGYNGLLPPPVSRIDTTPKVKTVAGQGKEQWVAAVDSGRHEITGAQQMNDIHKDALNEFGTIYRVQIQASKKYIPVNVVIQNNSLSEKVAVELRTDGWYRYYIGENLSLPAAKTKLAELQKRGIKDAFIVIFNSQGRTVVN
jgi:tetratricopeptide (TPR) repeat protein